MAEPEFPLYRRAAEWGVLDGRSALIVAPTATGKAYIGQQVILRSLERPDGHTHAYLVPFRALAGEIYDSFLDVLFDTDARVRIVAGDHRDPLRPELGVLSVATDESFSGLLQGPALRLGAVVAEEVHPIADDERGPAVEGLFARLLASGRLRTLCAPSAVVENAANRPMGWASARWKVPRPTALCPCDWKSG